LPGATNSEGLASFANIIGKAGKLEFRLVDTTVSPQDAQQDRAPLDDDLLYATVGSQTLPMLVKKQVLVEGEDLIDAQPWVDSRTGASAVNFKFNSAGTTKFGRATQENIGRPLAIILDNDIISAPVIRTPILGGSGQISGNFTAESASALAHLLRAGALPVNFKLLEIRHVQPASH
jgi:preprotein translocase subunit SecD